MSMPTERVIEALRARDLLELVEIVCAVHGVSVEAVAGRSRTTSVARARHAVWHELYHHHERCFSYPAIGRLFGCDHASVLYGVRQHARRLEEAAAKRCA